MRVGLHSSQDLLALLVRRKWWVIASFLGLSCAVAVLTFVLPKVFVSDTLILVRPRDVPENFVMDLIAGTAEERLRSIEQTILSRTNLLEILREFGDQMPEFSGLNMDQRVVKLRSQIDINFAIEKSTTGNALPLTYFRISYQNQSPELAQKIASKLTSLFIEQDNRARETQVFGTTEFLSAEFTKVSEALDASEETLRKVKSSRPFQLPEQLESNLRTLDRLSVQKQTNAEALDRYATMRLNLETQISQTPEFLPVLATAKANGSGSPNSLVEEYRKTKLEYEQAAAKYRPQHPEVLATQAHLDRLTKQMTPELLAEATKDPAEVAETKATMVPNPLYQRLLAQLKEVATEFGIREREKRFVESEMAKYVSRVENTPKAEQDIADILRQNMDLKKQYEDLKGKLEQARLSESLETKQKGSQFVIVDPANYPLVPTKPNRWYILLVGSLASLVISIGLAAVIDIARQKIWTQANVETFWGVPVLIDIPSILTDSDLALIHRKKTIYAASSAAGVIAYGFCLYVVYLKHDAVLQHLDPIVKLVYK
jgi:polysaccharide biosynthesis transport protein